MKSSGDRAAIVAKAFPSLGPQEVEALAALTRSKKCRSGDRLIRQNDRGDSVFIVRTGFYDVHVEDGRGNMRALGVMGEGEVFGELSLLDGGPRSATVIAHTRGELLCIDRDSFLQEVRRNPNLAIGLLARLAARIRSLTERCDDFAGLSVGQRLAKQVVLLADAHGTPIGRGKLHLGIKLSQNQLGQLVGARRESVNQHLKLWERKHLVERNGRQLIIVDVDALRALARGE